MKDDPPPDPRIDDRIARQVAALRAEQGLSLEALAARSGVSRSMLSLIERGECSATAVVLEKVATGLGVMLAHLFDGPAPASPLLRRADQPQWRDPQSGYRRRNVTPGGAAQPAQIVEVEFPAGARVAFETAQRQPPVHQQVWLLEGALDVTLGDELHRLSPGDCLAMQLDRPIVFFNPARKPARYAVVIVTPAAAPARPARKAA